MDQLPQELDSYAEAGQTDEAEQVLRLLDPLAPDDKKRVIRGMFEWV